MLTRKKSFPFCGLSILFSALMLLGNINGQNNIRVVGTVVDSQGNPIPKADAVLLSPPCLKQKNSKEWRDQINPAYTTHEDGIFFLDAFDNAKVARVLISEPIPERAWTPIPSPDLTLQCFPEFQGVIVKAPRSGATIQLNKISPQIKYKSVLIDLSKLFKDRRELLKSNPSLKMSVEYRGIKVVNSIRVEEETFDRIKNEVRFYLPTGSWNLLFEISNGNKKSIVSTKIKIE